MADYMKHLMEEDEEKYKTHFARFIKEGVTADGVSMSPNVLVGTLVYRGVSEYYIVMPIIYRHCMLGCSIYLCSVSFSVGADVQGCSC